MLPHFAPQTLKQSSVHVSIILNNTQHIHPEIIETEFASYKHPVLQRPRQSNVINGVFAQATPSGLGLPLTNSLVLLLVLLLVFTPQYAAILPRCRVFPVSRRPHKASSLSFRLAFEQKLLLPMSRAMRCSALLSISVQFAGPFAGPCFKVSEVLSVIPTDKCQQ
jgi:hypothetical protein